MHLSIASLIHCLYRCMSCSLLFISVPYFNNGVSIYVCYFGRLESLLNEMQFHDLNESYDSCELASQQFHHLKDSHKLAWPGLSLLRCSFTKSNVMLFS